MKVDLKHFVILNETFETGLELKKFFEEELGLPNRKSRQFSSYKSNPEDTFYYYGVTSFYTDVDNYSEKQVLSYKLPVLTLEEARKKFIPNYSNNNSYDIY